MTKALITGITGFAGSHLAEYLIARGDVEVVGMMRWRSKTENIDSFRHRLELVEGDVRDAHSLEEIMRAVAPDYIFHLAAQSFVPTSWKAPADTFETNAVGTIHLLEAARRLKPDAVFHTAGSSEEYGLVHTNELPIRETNPLRPLSPYGVSKVAEDLLGWQYFKSYGLRVIRTRAFNHTGPRRGEVFVTSNFAKQVAEIEKGLKPPVIYVGNLEARRDFTDVRDVVRGYWLAATKCDYGEVYNICSQKARRIRDVLDLLLSVSKVNVEVKPDPSRMRPADVDVLEGDCSEFITKTGWKAEIPFEKTMEDLLNYWRERVGGVPPTTT
ncbi:MAG: GDP-mannose 4,6-dehydratase [Dehalococcoidia bacterium]|nr:GDP-mannose 4,6-dehydratase [Dehalococcoidia bacterium]